MKTCHFDNICPLCGRSGYTVEEWNDNLYLVKCGHNSALCDWFDIYYTADWRKVSVHFPVK